MVNDPIQNRACADSNATEAVRTIKLDAEFQDALARL
jgi:hypothetical protein